MSKGRDGKVGMRDNVRDQVRAQIQELLVSAGVDQGRVAVEVLFWLPKEFLDAYQDLYMRALHLGDGDDKEKAGEDEGRIKAKVDGKLRGTARGLGMGVGGGKRYKKEWVVKDERALEVKGRVDRVLKELVLAEMRKFMEERREEKRRRGGESRGDGGGVGQTHGGTPGVGGGVLVEFVRKDGSVGKRCRDCGKIASRDWARCPYLHA